VNKSTTDLFAVLQLNSVPGLGSRRIRALIKRFKNPKLIFDVSVKELVQVQGIDVKLAQAIKSKSNPYFAESQFKLAEKAKAKIITYWDPEYPALLKKTSDPPVLLFIRGKDSCLNRHSISLVGTRMPSTYGKMMAGKFASQLVDYGFVITSGLARGIDTLCHSSVLTKSGFTVAVLGSGIDRIYPYENSGLAEEIVKSGALLSEFSMGTKPDSPHFPRRNRIISGLSIATIVIEAGEKSGALITADFSLEQGRDVFALPGNINNPKSLGCNRLIQQGAKLVTKVEDIIEEIAPQLQVERKKVDPDLKGLELEIVKCIALEAKHIDQIAKECRVPTAQALGALLSLELKDIVHQLAGKMFIVASR